MGYIPAKPTVNAGNIVVAQTLTVGTVAVSFAAFNANTDLVAFQVESGDVYVTFDGTTPSSSNGGQMYSGQSYHWNAETARVAKFVKQSTTASIYAQECVTALASSAMPLVEILKPRLTAF